MTGDRSKIHPSKTNSSPLKMVILKGSPYFQGQAVSARGRVWPPVANFPELPSKASELQPGAAKLLRTSPCGTSTKGTAGARTLAIVALPDPGNLWEGQS